MLSLRIVPLVGALALAFSEPAAAAVDCSNPDHLCTGDPCSIPTLELEDPCVVDFGDRHVILDGLARGFGRVDLTARSFTVHGLITTNDFGVGIILRAAADIEMRARVLLADPVFGPGSGFELLAGGSVLVDAPVSGPDLDFLIDAAGDVTVRKPVFAANIRFESGETLEVQRPLRTSAPGRTASIELTAAGDVLADTTIFQRGQGGVDVSSGGFVLLDSVRAFTTDRGTRVTIDAVGGVQVLGKITTSGAGLGVGGAILIDGGAGSISIGGDLLTGGGVITLGADGDVTVDGRLRAKASIVTVDSRAGDAVLLGKVDVRGQDGVNTIAIRGNSVRIDARRVTADGPGRQTYEARAGDLELIGRFSARVGGSIAGQASNDLRVQGRMDVGSGGCIALTAGGTLHLAGAQLDQPPSPACP